MICESTKQFVNNDDDVQTLRDNWFFTYKELPVPDKYPCVITLIVEETGGGFDCYPEYVYLSDFEYENRLGKYTIKTS